ncbi:MAG: hypothetical protein BIFFINMI_03948 [Phycisphaerae bacterium]|nr:hypothetical protein [Phycisphaerae bacterium]
MKTSRLFATLVGVAILTLAVANASAYYNPATGRFLQRDPGAGTTPAWTGTPARGSGFMRLDQYADGPSLYQYVRGNPAVGLDPDGQKRLVFMFEGIGGFAGNKGSLADPRFSTRSSQFDKEVFYDVSGFRGVADHLADSVVAAGGDQELAYYPNHAYVEALEDAINVFKVKEPLLVPPLTSPPPPGWASSCSYHTIAVIGFSYGGHEALKFADALKNRGVRVDLVFTVDPVWKLHEINLFFQIKKQPNTQRLINYYQAMDKRSLGGLPIHGRAVIGADNAHQERKRLNVMMPASTTRAEVEAQAHLWIVDDLDVRDSLTQEVRNVPETRAQMAYP